MGRYIHQFSKLPLLMKCRGNPQRFSDSDFLVGTESKETESIQCGFIFFISGALLIFILITSCTTLPEADFYEVDGIVSINARSLVEQNNWKVTPYHTSVSLVSFDNSTSESGTLTFPFYIQQPGQYSIWTLTTQWSHDPDKNFMPIRVLDNEQFLIDNFRLQLGQSNALQWAENDFDDGGLIEVFFEEPGHYSIVYDSGGQSGFVIDKIHISLNNAIQPSGFGFPETNDPNIDPILAKRDQPVVIPPAWAFGVLYGGHTNQQQTMERVSRLLNENYPIDGYWINDLEMEEDSLDYSHLNAMFRNLDERNIKAGITTRKFEFTNERQYVDIYSNSGIKFLKLPQKSDNSLLRIAFETTQKLGSNSDNRGFVLNHLNNIYEPVFKLYPANLIGNTVSEWSYPVYPDNEQGTMGGLKENIEMVANPRFSTYEVPFLSVNSGGYSTQGNIRITEELFIRWAQFAAFNTMMHIFASPENETSNLPYNFSDTAQQQFKELTQLRNRLFPYIYSLAHLVRSTGQKPVQGDGKNTTQFQLGDAFLIAPIYEEGAEERIVNLPAGTWYDYWDGTEFEGGSSWFIEAPLSKIPVFVRAGSIIPYREYSQSVLAGSNERLIIEIYGGGASSFRLYEDDGISTDYQRGDFTTTAFRYFEHTDYSTFTIGRMVRRYEGQPPEKELVLLFRFLERPATVLANHDELETGEGANQWMYDDETETLIVNWVQPNYQKTDFRIEF